MAPPSRQGANGGAAPKGSPKVFKVIIMGNSGVGKTCLTHRFCQGRFPASGTDATIGVDFREKLIFPESPQESVRMQLWDTAGQERFRRSMVGHYYRGVSAVVLVYDVTNPATFHDLQNWIQECEDHGLTADRIPMMLVGNKCDTGKEDSFRVDTREAQRFADDFGMPLFETSARDDDKADHVMAIFTTLAYKIKKRRSLMAEATTPENGVGHSSSTLLASASAAAKVDSKPDPMVGHSGCACS